MLTLSFRAVLQAQLHASSLTKGFHAYLYPATAYNTMTARIMTRSSWSLRLSLFLWRVLLAIC